MLYSFEVDFYKYCKLCEHSKKSEHFIKCNECLGVPMSYDSEKPINFKEKGEK